MVYDPRSAANPVVLPSLADLKFADISAKLKQKQQHLTPAPIPAAQPAADPYAGLDFEVDDSSGLIDVAQSSILQAGGNLADAGRGLSNYLFGSEFDDSSATGWSNQDIADELTGVSDAVRAQGAARQQAVADAVAADDWLGALVSGIKAAPYTLADSTGSLAELAVGTIGTGGIGLAGGLGLKALRGKQALDAVSKAKKVTTALGKTPEDTWLKSVQNAAKATPKALAQTSLLTADMVQQQREQFEIENKRPPTAGELFTMNAVTVAATPWMVKNLYLPRPLRNFGKASDQTKARAAAKGKEVSEKTIRDKFQNEVSKIVEKMDESAIRSMGKTIVDNTEKVFKAGGAEAVQEYAQSWAEILSVNAAVSNPEGFLKGAWEEFSDEKKRNQALQGAFLGFGAGGLAKGAISAPGAAVDTAVQTTKGLTKTAGKFAAKQAQKSADKLITDEQRAQIEASAKVKLEAHETLAKTNEDQTVELTKAKTFADIKDPELIKRYRNKAGKDRNLNDPKIFEEVSNAVQADLSGEVKTSLGLLKADKGYQFVKAGVTTAATAVAEQVNITKEDVDKAIKTTKAVGKTVANELKDLNKSATRGVVSLALDATSNQTRKGMKTLRTGLRQYTPDAIETVAKTIAPAAPRVAVEMRKIARSKRAAEPAAGIREDRLVGAAQLSDSVKIASNPSTFNERDFNLAGALQEDARGRWEDLETVETFEAALDAHVNSQSFKQGKNALPGTEVQRMRKKIEAFKKAYKKTPAEKAKRTAKKVAAAADRYAVRGAKATDRGIASALKTADKWVQAVMKSKPGKKIKQEVKDPDTGKTWTIQTNQEIENMFAGFRGMMEAAVNAGDPVQTKNYYDQITGILTSKKFIDKMMDTYGTNDVDAVIAKIKDGVPALKLDKDLLKALRKRTKKRAKKVEDQGGAVEITEETDLTDVDLENPGIETIAEDLTTEQTAMAEKTLEMMGRKVCK